MPSSKPANTIVTTPLSQYSAALRSAPELVESSGTVPSGALAEGKVRASPSIMAAPNSADSMMTARAEVAAVKAPAPAHDLTPSANSLSPGPNRNPSSDMALSHAKRRARLFSGVCSATRADTTGTTAATKKPVAARSA